MKTVYAYVVADLLHEGHLRHLQRARMLGDMLTVGVLTHDAVKEKKPAPVVGQSRRFCTMRHIRWVDKIIYQEQYSPMENLIRYKPDILAESVSHLSNSYMGEVKEYVEGYGGKVVVLPYTLGISSTKIKRWVVNAHKKKVLF